MSIAPIPKLKLGKYTACLPYQGVMCFVVSTHSIIQDGRFARPPAPVGLWGHNSLAWVPYLFSASWTKVTSFKMMIPNCLHPHLRDLNSRWMGWDACLWLLHGKWLSDKHSRLLIQHLVNQNFRLFNYISINIKLKFYSWKMLNNWWYLQVAKWRAYSRFTVVACSSMMDLAPRQCTKKVSHWLCGCNVLAFELLGSSTAMNLVKNYWKYMKNYLITYTAVMETCLRNEIKMWCAHMSLGIISRKLPIFLFKTANKLTGLSERVSDNKSAKVKLKLYNALTDPILSWYCVQFRFLLLGGEKK